jgi:hypothetical protein
VLIGTVLVALLMLSRIGRRVDRLAEQTQELVKHAEQEFAPKQPPEKQG